MTPMLVSTQPRRLRRFLATTLCASAAILPARAAARPPVQAPVDQVVANASPALVHIDVRFVDPHDADESIRVERPSTGILISEDGLILTAAHLVAEVDDNARDGKYWLVVHLADDRRFPATVVKRDLRTDLALLRLELPEGTVLPAVELFGNAHPAPGSRVVAISDHDDEHLYAFQGTVAHAASPIKLRGASLDPAEAFLTDARFHQLLDGAPLLDSHGRVVGIYNASHVRPSARDRDDDAEDAPLDYAVIVSTTSIHAAFGPLVASLTSNIDAPDGLDPEAGINAVATVAPAVVTVWVGEPDEFPSAAPADDPHGQRAPQGLGSGVIVDARGLVITSSHVFKRRRIEPVRVRLADGREFTGRALETRRNQLALIQLELPEGETLPVAEFGDSRLARSGEFVAAIGRPFTGANTLSVGVLGNLARGTGFYQVASWLHQGHWGGALVDANGRLIGITVERAAGMFRDVEEESYLGFAAPSERILEWFSTEWDANASVPATHAMIRDTEAQLHARETAVTRVVEMTTSSLINITVSKAMELESNGGFDPFGSNEPTFMPQSSGSGVIIDESGLAISNWHVVDSAVDRDGEQKDDYQVTVSLPDGREFIAQVLSTSRDDDLSLLKLQLEGGDVVQPVELADSDELVLGQAVVAIGNALSLSDSVSAGVLSCLSSDEGIRGRIHKYKGMLTTDAAINPGNSGGALLDLQGRLVGINSAGTVGLGLSIPVNRARDVFQDKLLSAKRLRSAYLGIELIEEDGRMVIELLDPVGPAARAGALEGDVVLSWTGKPVTGSIAWADLLLRTVAGVPESLKVERDGELFELTVQPISFDVFRARQFCGVEVEELDYEVEYQVIQDASRELYQAFTENSNAEPHTLMEGALRVVTALPVDTLSDVRLQGGDLLLGVTRLIYDTTTPRRELVRFETAEELLETITPFAQREAQPVECWVLRDGSILRTTLIVKWKR